MWFELASIVANPNGARYRDELAKRMKPDEIAEAQKLAREWKPKENP